MIRIDLPKDVVFIIKTIEEAGYEAYAVGGCIRDSLLNKQPGDYDITTSAEPYEIKKLFRRTIDTGIEHGTVTVMLKKTGYEITTYRIDGKYEDSRHPSEVKFTRSLNEDLKRRDFTINAMAYNPKSGLIDPFGGQEDMERKRIRCVGDPVERFSEDALRMMRAVRFSAQLGYDIDSETLSAIKKLAPSIGRISAERIQTELVKLLLSGHPEAMRTAYECGLTAVFMPEFDDIMRCEQNNPHHIYTVGEHTIKAMQNVRPDRLLRLAMLFHDFGKPQTKTTDETGTDHFHGHPAVSEKLSRKILRRLKFDNYTTDNVSKLAFFHDYRVEADKRGVRRAMNRIGEELFPLVLEVKKADILAQSDFERENKLENLKKLNALYKEVTEENSCVSLKNLEIKGGDLMKLGFKAGPALGDELEKLLDMVIEDPSLNKHEILLKLAEEDL